MAIGLRVEQVAVQVQKYGSKGVGFKKQKQVQNPDRGSGAKSRGRTADLKETVAVKSQVSEGLRRADCGFEVNTCGWVAGFWTADVGGPRV